MKKQIDRISSDELRQWVKTNKSMAIIDTLPAELFRQRHLPGSQNACVYEVTFSDQVKAVVSDKSHEIVLYGSSEASSDAVTAAEKLERFGYKKVYVLNGGVAAWHEAGYPLEGDNIHATMKPDNILSLLFCADK